MHRNGRLTAWVGALLWCAGAACQRDAGNGAGGQRSDDTTAAAGSVADACAPNGQVPPVTSGGIGVARIGAPVREVAHSCQTRDTTFTLGEGIQENGAVIEFAGHRVLTLTAGDRTISRLIVADSAFRTERGLGVGSTVGQLRQAYGPVKHTGRCAGQWEREQSPYGSPGCRTSRSVSIHDCPISPPRERG
jgi:hypothetical protein